MTYESPNADRRPKTPWEERNQMKKPRSKEKSKMGELGKKARCRAICQVEEKKKKKSKHLQALMKKQKGQ